MPSESLETLHDLFVHELRDLYDAENQLIKALPLMSQAAQSPELKQAFDNHLRETKEQARRIEQVFRGLGEKPSGKSCKAMQGLVAEAKELLEEDADPNVMDAALIVAAQKVEHYEIAGYGSVCTFGRVLGYNDATEILKETMAEEERTDKMLTEIASKLNPQAESADQAGEAPASGDTEGMGEGGEAAGGRQRGAANREETDEEQGGSMTGGGRRSQSRGSNRVTSRQRSSSSRMGSSRGSGSRSGSKSRSRSGGSRSRRSSGSSRSRRSSSSRR